MESSSTKSPTLGSAPIREKTETDSLSNIRQSFKNKGFPPQSVEILCAGWASSTHKQYHSYFKKWNDFCEIRKASCSESNIKTLIEFFTFLFEKGYAYSSINTAKSALLTTVTVDNSYSWNDNPDVLRFFKGIYNLKPPLPKYTYTWDVNILLNFLECLMPLSELTLKDLTIKAVALTALASGNRAQSIHEMKINLLSESEDRMCFFFDCKLKTSKPQKTPQTLTLHKFQREELCVVRTLKEYISKTEKLRNSPKFWISWKKPFQPIGRQTISRWLKKALQLSGIDTSQFTAHSIRMASSSKANAMGVGLSTILRTAGWSTESNFKKFYLRDKASDDLTFSDAVLDTAH